VTGSAFEEFVRVVIAASREHAASGHARMHLPVVGELIAVKP
jgi:hypothetical protein